MSEEKLLILKMLREGKITEDEALKLIDAVGERTSSKSYINAESIENFGEKMIKKISTTVDKAMKKAGEAISNIDFEQYGAEVSYNFGGRRLNAKLEQYENINIANPESYVINLENNNGKIKVFSWNEDKIELISKIYYDDRIIPASEKFVLIEDDGKKLSISPDYDRIGHKNYIINFSLALPTVVYEKLDLINKNGSIEINFVEADKMLAHTSNGKVQASYTRANIAELSTTNSSVVSEFHEGESLELRSTNGKVQAIKSDVEELNLKTTNGSVFLKGVGEKTRNISAKNTNGSIDIDFENSEIPAHVTIEHGSRYTSSSKLSDRFCNVNRNGNTVYASTINFDSDSESALRVNIRNTNGGVKIS